MFNIFKLKEFTVIKGFVGNIIKAFLVIYKSVAHWGVDPRKNQTTLISKKKIAKHTLQNCDFYNLITVCNFMTYNGLKI